MRIVRRTGIRAEGPRRRAISRAVGMLLLLAGIAAALAAQTALASGGPTVPARHTAGYVPAHGSDVSPNTSPNDLEYHGGPVMRTNKTYAIYWQPAGYSFSANYKTLIDRYFSDVAAASGATSNVYAVETQYYDTTGPIAYSSSFGGSVTDTTPFPVNGFPSCGGPSKCLSDAQLQAEIQSVITKQGWTKNLTTQFFLFTPNNVGSCDGPGSCTYTVFCAYHGYGAGNLIYANQPYADHAGCRSGQRPNGDAADDTINVTSHEHREAINDERLNAWYDDQSGNEGSDLCAWNFGTPLGGAPGAQYNQVINGHNYYLQQEWSNVGSTCLLQYGSSGGSAPTVTSFTPTSGPVGTSVTVNGSNFTGVTAVKFNTTAATSYTVNSSTKITASVPSGATNGPISVSNGSGTGTSSSSFTVTGGGGGGAPTITSFSPAYGFTGSKVIINGTNFTGATSVKLGTASASFTITSATRISATVPTLSRGTYKWSVTTPGGTATSAGNFFHF